jgi:hypothetical protein
MQVFCSTEHFITLFTQVENYSISQKREVKMTLKTGQFCEGKWLAGPLI